MDATTTDTASTNGRNDKSVVHVQILGQQLAIRGEADQEYILGVAGYVDRKMREITEQAPGRVVVQSGHSRIAQHRR